MRLGVQLCKGRVLARQLAEVQLGPVQVVEVGVGANTRCRALGPFACIDMAWLGIGRGLNIVSSVFGGARVSAFYRRHDARLKRGFVVARVSSCMRPFSI